MKKTNKMVTASLFSALICVSTVIIQIPIPATGGFVNFGDCFVIVCAMMLSRNYSAIAAGIGASLADLLCGYAIYAPATLIIKALMALTAGTVYSHSEKGLPAKLISSLASEAVMCLGYLIYEALILGYKFGAFAGLIPNLLQGLTGIISSVIIITALEKLKSAEKLR